MTSTEKELRESLKETREALALTTFFSRYRHPDQETAEAIERVLSRARDAIKASEEASGEIRL